ncbi:MAG TPA: sugar phosphate nucleotidyltransferase [Nitrospiria bacterium]|nr:sugar phosphate nucleotidyltransferase [Nitrospiria bacterium]
MANGTCGCSTRCGIVLAGGAGQRLRSFVYRLRGDALPKQYVRFTGSRSLLEQTLDRVERIVPPERVFTVATMSHLQFPDAQGQLECRPPGTVILQPENRETAPGVLLPLVHLEARYPNALVAVFPSDHFIDPEGLFMGYVDLAFRAVGAHPGRLVLLGVKPDRAEPEYGYIVPEPLRPGRAGSGVRRVSSFVEKPASDSVAELALRGGLWNTMVMVFRPRTVMDAVARVAPALHRAFDHVRRAFGTSQEARVVEEVYRDIEPANFSRTVLEAIPGRRSPSLVVLPVRGVYWSDWGSEQRIANTLTRTTERPFAVQGASNTDIRAEAV